MASRYYDLPPLTALAAFEAAGRHLSFKRAAKELNVTPGAVSHQIRALEQELGLDLFHRVHRGVALSDEGAQLFRVLRGAMTEISDHLRQMRGRAETQAVTVGATTAMSALWLTPMLTRFWTRYPDIRIDQVVSDRLEFDMAKPELVVSYGPYKEPSYDNTPILADVLIPLCSPAFAARHQPRTLADLATLPLIHVEAPDIDWTNWADWFAKLGYSGRLHRGIKVNRFMIAVQAAQEDAGLVLGWKWQAAPLLRGGTMVGLNDFTLPAPQSYFLSRLRRHGRDRRIDILQDWILRSAAEISDEMNSP